MSGKHIRKDPLGHAILIKRCQLPWCGDWFIGEPGRRFCEPHRHHQHKQIMSRNGLKGKPSQLSEEQVAELRWMFHRYPAIEIAKHFGISRSHVYRVYHNGVQNPRAVHEEKAA